MLVFLNKKDLVDDELLQLDKLEVRKLFCSYDFTDNDVPIVFGFALLASQALMVNPIVEDVPPIDSIPDSVWLPMVLSNEIPSKLERS
ncbi:hypothetical protein V6N13_139715 [Hibiscus sabdariffa]